MSEQPCWHTTEVVNEMNRFYDEHKDNAEVKVHFNAFVQLLALTDEKGTELLDLGCGTAMLSEYCQDNIYIGADLPHIISGCAMRNYPQFFYKGCNMLSEELSWIEKYNIVSMNAVIDVMEHPLEMLRKVLSCASKYIILHRQEITEHGRTHTVKRDSYGGYTWHSIISRKDFNELMEENDFEIVKELKLDFSNWENGGCSFLLRKRRSWALYGLDFKLNKILGRKKNGFFIEAGANDGIRQSNTLFLEFYKNYSGILIEPVYDMYKECCQNRSSNTIKEHAALVSDEYGKTEIEIRYMPAVSPHNKGLLSAVDEPKYVDINIENSGEDGKIILRSPALTLNSILEKHKDRITEIDILILDIEGYELEALKGIDFNKWRIEYLLIEEREKYRSFNIIEEYLSPWYTLQEALSKHDYLYKIK